MVLGFGGLLLSLAEEEKNEAIDDIADNSSYYLQPQLMQIQEVMGMLTEISNAADLVTVTQI